MNANFVLRTTKELIEELKLLAKEDGRSLNKEIEYILKQFVISRTSHEEQ